MTQRTRIVLTDGQEIHLDGITINAQVGDQLFLNQLEHKKQVTVIDRSWAVNMERKPMESVLTILTD